MKEKKYYRAWIFFFSAIVLVSPLLDGGDSWQTLLWLRPLIIGGAIFFLLRGTGRPGLELQTPAQAWLIIAVILSLSVSLFTTHYYYLTLSWYFTFLVYLLLFFLALQLLAGPAGPSLISALILVLFLAGLIQSLAGIAQYLFRHPTQAAGTFFNPSYYAGYLAGLLAFPLAGLSFDLFPDQPARKKLALKIGCGILCALIFTGMLVSASRSIIFALIPLGLILISRFRLKGFLAVIALALALAAIPNPLRTRFLHLSQDPYAWERVGVWKTSLKMMTHHPLGVGLGMFQFYSQRYPEPFQRIKFGRFGLHATQAHNEFLNFAAEASPLLPIFALIFLMVIFPRVFRAMRNAGSDPAAPGRISAFAGALLAVLGHSLVDYNLHQPPMMVLAALSLAGLIALVSRSDPSVLKKRELGGKRSLFLRLLIPCAGVLIALLVTAQAWLEGSFIRGVMDPDHSRAIARLEGLSQIPSGYAPVYFQLGINFEQAFENADDPRWSGRAIADLSRAATLNPENQEYFYQLAQAEYRASAELNRPEFLDRALKHAERAVELAPGQVFSYLLISDIYLAKKDFAGAKRILGTALEYEPYFFQARLQLIRILFYQKDLQPAKAQAEILLDQSREYREFEKARPNLLNYYQKQIVAISEDDLGKISAWAEPE